MEQKNFINELGNPIVVKVYGKKNTGKNYKTKKAHTFNGVTIFMAGPSSHTQLNITRREAVELNQCLKRALAPARKSSAATRRRHHRGGMKRKHGDGAAPSSSSSSSSAAEAADEDESEFAVERDESTEEWRQRRLAEGLFCFCAQKLARRNVDKRTLREVLPRVRQCALQLRDHYAASDDAFRQGVAEHFVSLATDNAQLFDFYAELANLYARAVDYMENMPENHPAHASRAKYERQVPASILTKYQVQRAIVDRAKRLPNNKENDAEGMLLRKVLSLCEEAVTAGERGLDLGISIFDFSLFPSDDELRSTLREILGRVSASTL